MQLSCLALGFLVLGVWVGWGTVAAVRSNHPTSGQHPNMQAVGKWLIVTAVGMASLSAFLIGLVLLWYPADSHGHIHPPANSVGYAGQLAAIILGGGGFCLLIAGVMINRSLHPKR